MNTSSLEKSKISESSRCLHLAQQESLISRCYKSAQDHWQSWLSKKSTANLRDFADLYYVDFAKNELRKYQQLDMALMGKIHLPKKLADDLMYDISHSRQTFPSAFPKDFDGDLWVPAPHMAFLVRRLEKVDYSTALIAFESEAEARVFAESLILL